MQNQRNICIIGNNKELKSWRNYNTEIMPNLHQLR